MYNATLELYPPDSIDFSVSNKNLFVDKIISVILVEDQHEEQVTEQQKDNLFITSTSIHKLVNLICSDRIKESIPHAILFSNDVEIDFNSIQVIKKFCDANNIPFFYYESDLNEVTSKSILKHGFDDCYTGNLNASFLRKIEITKRIKHHRIKIGNRRNKAFTLPEATGFKMWTMKRAFDIAFALTCIIILLPLMALIALAVRLESKGPVLYISKRAGRNYKIFNFYKFRSMRVGADAELKKLAHLNQYGSSSFFKIKDDPRITSLGKFLRTTSLDELPQLFNVLFGHMSLVGNRPLPLYEAEKLTKDQIAWRFLAPAGITGLWQVTKRGKADMSEEERIQLDMEYAMKNSFWFDAKILMSTIPALLQKEVS
jgi:lipopolysaccharide/colanic/teichoic acid biosynthesis glycosyltransferase